MDAAVAARAVDYKVAGSLGGEVSLESGLDFFGVGNTLCSPCYQVEVGGINAVGTDVGDATLRGALHDLGEERRTAAEGAPGQDRHIVCLGRIWEPVGIIEAHLLYSHDYW